MRKVLIAAALSCLAAGSSLAAPVVVDFEDVPLPLVGFSDMYNDGMSFTSHGFTFTSARLQPNVNGGVCSPVCAANGTHVLLEPGTYGHGLNEIRMIKQDRGMFFLEGVDFAEMFSGGFPQFAADRIFVQAYFGGVPGDSIVLLNDDVVDGPGGSPDFRTASFLFDGADMIVFTGSGPPGESFGFSIDNLIVNLPALVDPDNNGVPGPAALPLLALGLLGLGATRRRA